MAKKKISPRYINANLAKEALIGWDTDATDEEIEYAIDNVPTADVAEVVRCKDCKHYFYGICTRVIVSEPIRVYMTDNDFCSYGAKMDGGKEE